MDASVAVRHAAPRDLRNSRSQPPSVFTLASPRCEDTCVTCGGMLLCITCAGLNWKRAAVREPWGGCLWRKSAEALKERGWKRGQQVDEAESMSMSSVSK